MVGRKMLAVGLLLLATVPAHAQDHRFALTGFAGAASYSDLTLEADTELLLGSGAWTGAQAEAWFGRFGVRLNGGVASPSLADDPATGFGLVSGDLDVLYRLRWPEPGLFFQPFAAGGLGAVRYDLDPDASTVAGEAYDDDPATRTTLMLGVGADFGSGPVALRLELMDIIGVTSPLTRTDGSEYGPVQHVVLTLGLSYRAGRIQLPPKPERPAPRPRQPTTRVPPPTRFPPQRPDEPEETEPPDEPDEPDEAEPEEQEGPVIPPPDEPGEPREPPAPPVEPSDTTPPDTTPRMQPPPPTPTPTPREPVKLPPDPHEGRDTTVVPPGRELPGVERTERPRPPPDTTTTPPPDTTTAPPPDTAAPPPADTTVGGVKGRLFAVEASWLSNDEDATARGAALADSVTARGLPVVQSEGRIRGRPAVLLRVGALRNAADANTLGTFVEAAYDLGWEWVHIAKDEAVPAADVAASEAFVEELKEQYGQGTPSGRGPP